MKRARVLPIGAAVASFMIAGLISATLYVLVDRNDSTVVKKAAPTVVVTPVTPVRGDVSRSSPTERALTAQVRGDIALVVSGDIDVANESLRQFQVQYPECKWANNSGRTVTPRQAGSEIDAAEALLRAVAPYPPVFGVATLTDRDGTFWIVVAASCE